MQRPSVYRREHAFSSKMNETAHCIIRCRYSLYKSQLISVVQYICALDSCGFVFLNAIKVRFYLLEELLPGK